MRDVINKYACRRSKEDKLMSLYVKQDLSMETYIYPSWSLNAIKALDMLYLDNDDNSVGWKLLVV